MYLRISELVSKLEVFRKSLGDLDVCLNFREIEGMAIRRVPENSAAQPYIMLLDGDIEVITEPLFKNMISNEELFDSNIEENEED